MTDQALDNLARRVILDTARLEYGNLMEELPEQDFSPEFERKMKKLIRQADHPVRHRCLRTVQLAALLAVLLMLVTVATAAAGYDIWRMLAEWTAEQITLAPGHAKSKEEWASEIEGIFCMAWKEADEICFSGVPAIQGSRSV